MSGSGEGGGSDGGKNVSFAMARGLDAMQFAESRVQEIKALLRTLKGSERVRRVHQMMPRHMRRRASSHNPRRLPIRLREVALREMAKIPAPKKSATVARRCREKKRSRRNRRRPANLNREYAKRSAHKTWLQTHIWHAKRFQMEALWGWRVPVRSNEKSVRANYRWVKGTHCTLADISYHSCFQLTGPRSCVRAALSLCLPWPQRVMDGREHQRLIRDVPRTHRSARAAQQGGVEETSGKESCDSGTGGQQPAPAVSEGKDEGELLGIVSIIASPYGVDTDGEGGCHVWVWAHPAIAKSVHRSLSHASASASAAAAAAVGGVEEQGGHEEGLASGTSGKASASKSGEPASCGQRKKRSAGAGVVVSDISGEVCRFRVVGGGSHALLTRTLHAVDHVATSDMEEGGGPAACRRPMDTAGDENGGAARDDASNADAKTMGTQSDPSDLGKKMLLQESDTDLWRDLQDMRDPTQLSCGATLCLTVWDPRLRTPATTRPPTTPAYTTALPQSREEWVTTSVVSPLFSQAGREASNSNKPRQRDIDMSRSKRRTEIGGDLQPCNGDAVLPLLLIQQPGSRSQGRPTVFRGPGDGFGCGWDVVLPATWAREVWHALVLAGAKTCGMRDLRQHAVEQGVLCFPFDAVGTRAHHMWRAHDSLRQLTKFAKRPPAKRNNYVKLGVLFPFGVDFSSLANIGDAIKVGQEKPVDNLGFTCVGEKAVLNKQQQEQFAKQLHTAATNLSTKCILPRTRGALPQALYSPTMLSACVALAQGRSNEDIAVADHTLVPVEVQVAGRGRLDERTALCAVSAGDVRVASTSPLLLECTVALPTKKSAPMDHEFRAIVGGLTTGCFCHARATDYGVGFVTLAGLKRCGEATRALRSDAAAMAPRGRGAGAPKRGKKTSKARGKRGGKRRPLQDAKLEDTFLVLTKHPDSREYRVGYLRVLDTSWLEA